MKKDVSITAVLVVALLTGLAPVRAAQAAPMFQMRAAGNLSQRINPLPGTVLNTQTRLTNLGGNLVSPQAIQSISVVQTPRQPVVDRITRIAPPVVPLDATQYLRSANELTPRPIDISLPTLTSTDAIRALADGFGNNNTGKGNGNGKGGNGDGSGGDGKDGGKGDKGNGSSGRKGGGSGYFPPPPGFDITYYYIDDDGGKRRRARRLLHWVYPH